VLLSETKYKYQVEADVAPFRGLLLGLFFVTVGFSIDCGLLLSEWPKVLGAVCGLLAFKASAITLLCRYIYCLYQDFRK
jgi:Kef-type K+ transport system membrane component KefB